jgi:predicted amidohydrolase YtcJ
MGNLDDAIALGIQTGFGSPSLNIGSLKLFADGALGSQTASMLDPFEGTADDYGIVVNTKEDLLHMMKKAAEAGISSAVHAIGDKANKEILDIYEAIFPISQAHHLRQRIEHAQLIEASDFPRFRNLNVIASVQPLHATSDMDIVDKHWGARGKGAYAFKTFIQHGITSAYGSDVPVETFDPIKGIFAAVSRRRETMLNIPAWYPDQRLSPHEAVFGYTASAAYASYEDNIKGTLTVGKLADMVVLSKDIFKVPEEEILETTVDLTIIDGKIVYAHQI